MKSIFGKLGYVFIFLFLTGILATGYYLFSFPELLQEKAINSVNIDIAVVLSQIEILNYLVLASAFFALASITFLLVSGKNGDSDNVVYVETYKNKEDDSTANTQQQNLQSKYNERVAEVQKIINQDENEKLILNRVLSKICKDLAASQGAIFKSAFEDDKRFIELWATFAYSVPDSLTVRYEFGEGLAGQAAKSGNMLNLKNVPEGYIKILSGLGSASPSHLMIVPLKDENTTHGVIEIASFVEFNSDEEDFVKVVASLLAKKLGKAQEEVITESQDKN